MVTIWEMKEKLSLQAVPLSKEFVMLKCQGIFLLRPICSICRCPLMEIRRLLKSCGYKYVDQGEYRTSQVCARQTSNGMCDHQLVPGRLSHCHGLSLYTLWVLARLPFPHCLYCLTAKRSAESMFLLVLLGSGTLHRSISWLQDGQLECSWLALGSIY